jgi:hypothetical protein
LFGTVPDYSFEKRLLAASRFSKKEFCAIPISVPTYRKRGNALCYLHKRFANSKGFGLKGLRSYYSLPYSYKCRVIKVA